MLESRAESFVRKRSHPVTVGMLAIARWQERKDAAEELAEWLKTPSPTVD